MQIHTYLHKDIGLKAVPSIQLTQIKITDPILLGSRFSPSTHNTFPVALLSKPQSKVTQLKVNKGPTNNIYPSIATPFEANISTARNDLFKCYHAVSIPQNHMISWFIPLFKIVHPKRRRFIIQNNRSKQGTEPFGDSDFRLNKLLYFEMICF